MTFGISDDGMLTVSAFHVGYGSNEFNLTIDGDSGRLTEEEMKEMLANAEEHKDQDKELRLSLAAKASLDSYCFQLKNYVTDDKLMVASEDEKDEDEQPIMIPIAALEDVQESLDALLEMIEETAAYIVAHPFESTETYGARRSELQSAADPVVEHLRQVFEDLRIAAEKAAEPNQPGEEGEGGEEGEEGDEWGNDADAEDHDEL